MVKKCNYIKFIHLMFCNIDNNKFNQINMLNIIV